MLKSIAFNFFVLVCNAAAIPQIGNGTVNVSASDMAPYFIGDMIRYQCNDNFGALEADLTNECVANSDGSGALADWLRGEANLTNICQEGNYVFAIRICMLLVYRAKSAFFNAVPSIIARKLCDSVS